MLVSHGDFCHRMRIGHSDFDAIVGASTRRLSCKTCSFQFPPSIYNRWEPEPGTTSKSVLLLMNAPLRGLPTNTTRGGGEHLAQLADPGRLAQDAVDVRRNIAVIQQSLSPAGQQYHPCLGSGGFHRTGDFAPVDVWHSEVGDDDVIGITGLLGRQERVYAGLATLSGDHVMSVRLDYGAHRFKDE